MKVTRTLDIKLQVKEVIRLGNANAELERPRPIRIKLDSKYVKEKFVASAHRLRASPQFKNIYIKPDLTFKERSLQKELRLELFNKIREQPEKRWKIRNNLVIDDGIFNRIS